MNRSERAMQVWMILISAAEQRKTLTYGMVANHLGFHGAGVLAKILGRIMRYCEQHELPPLTCIVVSRNTGVPGSGLTTVKSLPEDIERVFRYNWYARYPVQIADFDKFADQD